MARRKITNKANAIVTLYGTPDWTPEKLRDVAQWLRRNARWLEQHASELGPVFRARYFDR